MGLKKYEIITVGSDKRVRALRSWQVGDRYVNIGDVGGIVYDEKTLSQDGLCWLFRGNFGFPGARIGGDSIVDIGEAAPGVTGSANVDILGSSVVVGAPVRFSSDQTAADAVTLTAADFEQGDLSYVKGANWETWKLNSPNQLRTKNPIFAGGVTTTLNLSVPGYQVQAYALDRDGIGLAATLSTDTGAGVTLVVPAGQYMVIKLAKNPVVNIVPADATAAQLKFTGTYDTKLVMVDSRLELNPATSTGVTTIRPGGNYTFASGAKYPDSVITDSKVIINATSNRGVRFMSDLSNVNATIDATTADAQSVGTYRSVNNLVFSGVLTGTLSQEIPLTIQAYNCNNFAVSPTIFPGLAAARTANTPFIFLGCNVPNGRFYHHAQIANTYRDINFDLATADLGKATASGQILASAEVEGMYRLYSTTGSLFGALAEAHDSVKSLNMTGGAATYGTTIYKDAYFNGTFDFAGTNVFGHTMKHDASNTQNVMAVQGIFNATRIGEKITGIVATANRVVVAEPFRLNGSLAFTVNNDTNIETQMLTVDPSGNIINQTSWAAGTRSLTVYANTVASNVYIAFRKAGDVPIAPDDVKGITVTTYNGCRIVNTGETAVNMKGNIRVEDNATLVNASIKGSGYFGGNAVMSGMSVNGCAYMKDNATFVKTGGAGVIRNLKMTENAYAVMGDFPLNGRIHLSDNARFTPTTAGLSEGDLVMKDNAVVSGAVTIGGVLTMKDNAEVSAGVLSTYGDITLCGSYNQTVNKTWTGKRVIDNENAPEYDNNVKTQYDF